MEWGRGRRLRGLVLLVLVSVVLEVVTAAIITGHHQHNTHEAENHVEDEYLEDALENWLYNFDTYTFMIKQDIDHHHHDSTTSSSMSGEEEVEEEEDEEGERELWSAPITVSIDEHGLLNPHKDYVVTVESLVAEAGTIFLTLSAYQNKSRCGVGGVTRHDPPAHTHLPTRHLAIGGDHNDTLINFEVEEEGNSNTSQARSEWVEVSGEYWWASGRLGGGGLLSLTFTPPDCGCLTLSTYYALPAGNLTLVVGPQAYPSELQMLLCVDPSAQEDDDNYDSDDDDTETSDYIGDEAAAESEALVASGADGGATVESRSSNKPHVVNGRSTRQRSRQDRKEAKRLAKKKKRQQKRQKIRRAGRRQARRQAASNGGNARSRNRKQRKQEQRQAKKAWKKIKRQNKRQLRQNRRRNHLAGNSTTEEPVHHNTTHPQAEEEKLVDLLLGNTTYGNSSAHGNSSQETQVLEERDGQAADGEAAEEGDSVGDAAEGATGRGHQRMNRRMRKKMRRMERKKATHPPGIKFCCKQGVKHKKYMLTFSSTTEEEAVPPTCNSNTEVVATFANYQFKMAQDTCTEIFGTCCGNFTSEIWDQIKARKAARRMQRKQRRKSRRQQRRQGRKWNRKARRQQGRHQDGEAEAEHHSSSTAVPGEVDVAGVTAAE